jgi:predicted dehydrogenase
VAAVGVGIVGLGFGARVHLPGFRLLDDPGLTIEAVCSADAARAEELARREGVRAHASWRELVDDAAVSLVSIATPPAHQVEIASAALAAGKAVLCEKPLGLTTAQATTLVPLAGRIPLLVNFGYRALPAFRLAHDLVEADELGEIEEILIAWRVRARPDGLVPWSWKDSAEGGGGALLAYGVHMLDLVDWLGARPLTASATFETSTSSRADAGGQPRRATAEDGFDATLTLPGGAQASISVSLVWDGEPLHRVELVGTRARLVLENTDVRDPVRPWRVTLDSQVLAVTPAPWQAAAGDDPRVEPFAVHAAELVAAIRGGRQGSPSLRDALDVHAVAEAVTQSASSGKPEPVASLTFGSAG